jgi:hypothetical protein
MPLADQRAIAKSLITLHMNAENASKLAETTGVKSAILIQIATKIMTCPRKTQPLKTGVLS